MEERHGKGNIDPAPHARNFLDCIRSREQTNCDTLTGHLSPAATLIGNVALRTRSYLEWDAKTERFTNNPAANQWLSYKYRAPYKLGDYPLSLSRADFSCSIGGGRWCSSSPMP